MFKSPLQLAIIAVVLFIFFGANKLPEAAKSIGQSLKIFKQEINDMKDTVKTETTEAGKAVDLEVK